MYDNIGGKIKKLAEVSAIIMIISCIIIGLVLIITFADYSLIMTLIGIAVMVVGSLISWVSSWLLYAFGELVENTTALRTVIEKDKTKKAPKIVDDTLPEL